MQGRVNAEMPLLSLSERRRCSLVRGSNNEKWRFGSSRRKALFGVPFDEGFLSRESHRNEAVRAGLERSRSSPTACWRTAVKPPQEVQRGWSRGASRTRARPPSAAKPFTYRRWALFSSGTRNGTAARYALGGTTQPVARSVTNCQPPTLPPSPPGGNALESRPTPSPNCAGETRAVRAQRHEVLELNVVGVLQ